MQDVFVSTVERLHDVDGSVWKLKNLKNKNFALVISSSRTLLANKFYMCNLLTMCHMIPLHAVGPILEVDVQVLENEVNNGHRDGESQTITIDIIEGWDLHWCNENNTFESSLSLDLVLVILKR